MYYKNLKTRFKHSYFYTFHGNVKEYGIGRKSKLQYDMTNGY